MDTQYQLTVSGNNFLFSQHITYEQLRKITSFLLTESQTTSVSPPTTRSTPTPNVSTVPYPPGPDLASFMADTKAQRTPEKITALAYHLWADGGVGEFDKTQILTSFQQAMEPVPRNLNRDLRWAEQIGWIEEKPDTSGIFYLTQAGRVAVEQKFPPSLRKKTTITRAKPKP